MFRKIQDFREAWEYETKATLKIFRALTESSLNQAVVPGGRTLGHLAWHIAVAVGEMLRDAGLVAERPTEAAAQPPLPKMIHQYEENARDAVVVVERQWKDEMLDEEIPMYGESWKRGGALAALISHQAHHRAQMTVLMRQAGLKVPGIYGPSREEWAEYNLPPQP